MAAVSQCRYAVALRKKNPHLPRCTKRELIENRKSRPAPQHCYYCCHRARHSSGSLLYGAILLYGCQRGKAASAWDIRDESIKNVTHAYEGACDRNGY